MSFTKIEEVGGSDIDKASLFSYLKESSAMKKQAKTA